MTVADTPSDPPGSPDPEKKDKAGAEGGAGDQKQSAGSGSKGEEKEEGKDKGDDKDGDKKDDGADDKKDDKDKKPSPLKKTWVRVVLGIVFILLIVAATIWFYRYWTHGRFVQSTNNAYLQTDQVVVSSKVAGTVEEVLVNDNDEVVAGQPLVRIDDSINRARVEQARAQARQARASIRQYASQIHEQEAAIDQSRAQAGGSRAKLLYAQGEVDRYAPLASTGAERAERLTEMVNNRDQAAASLVHDDAAVAQSQRRVATLVAQAEVAEAQVEEAQAQAQQAQTDVDSAFIRASVAGRVGDRQVRVGQYAQAGTRLLTVVPVQALYLIANFKETQIGLMRIGQPATIVVDALGGDTVSGSVESFSPATGAEFALIPPNNATGNFTKIVQRVPVKIRVDAGPEAWLVLRPGLSVEVSVDTLGSKDEKARRKQEGKDDKDEIEQRRRDDVERDRQIQKREADARDRDRGSSASNARR